MSQAEMYPVPESSPPSSFQVVGGEAVQPKTSAWIVFSAVILMVAGVSRVFDAIWAFRYNGVLPNGLQAALFGTSLSTYGWLWVGVGAVLVLAGIGLFSNSQVSRWVGVVAAAIGGLSAMAWMPFYPVWSLMYVAAAAVIIYSLVVHGGRQAA